MLEDVVPSALPIVACGGSRKRFALETATQAFRRPAWILYDHVDIAQCQTIFPVALRTPYAVWVHGVEVWKSLPPRKLAALRSANLLIFNSEFTRARFDQFHRFKYRGVVVHLAAELSPDVSHGNGRRRPWILTVGRLEPGRPKGHAEILGVMPDLVRQIPDVRWHVVGAGKHLDTFREQVSASGCVNNVIIHGFLESADLLDLYRQCRVFCMPSHGEGFGIVYLEAMAQGCVPIGSTLDAAPEVIGDGGFCVPIDDRETLLHRLTSLLRMDEPDFHVLSKQAVARAAQFSQATFSARMSSALGSCFCAGDSRSAAAK